jgi:hypothetical protein
VFEVLTTLVMKNYAFWDITPCLSIFLFMALQPLWTLAAFSLFNLYTVGRTPWTGDQSVAGLLHTHRTDTDTE